MGGRGVWSFTHTRRKVSKDIIFIKKLDFFWRIYSLPPPPLNNPAYAADTRTRTFTPTRQQCTASIRAARRLATSENRTPYRETADPTDKSRGL